MKTILKIITILLAAALVCAGFYLAVGSSPTSSSAGFDGRQPPNLQNGADGSSTRPEGEEGFHGERGEGGASVEGVLGMFGSLLKISVIAALVLLIQKGLSKLKLDKVETASPAQ